MNTELLCEAHVKNWQPSNRLALLVPYIANSLLHKSKREILPFGTNQTWVSNVKIKPALAEEILHRTD